MEDTGCPVVCLHFQNLFCPLLPNDKIVANLPGENMPDYPNTKKKQAHEGPVFSWWD